MMQNRMCCRETEAKNEQLIHSRIVKKKKKSKTDPNVSYEKNRHALVGLPLIDPSSGGTFGLHRKWLLGGNFPLLVPARIYKHKEEVKIKTNQNWIHKT